MIRPLPRGSMTAAAARQAKNTDDRFAVNTRCHSSDVVSARGLAKGRIINVTSILGERGLINSTAYCAAKAGVINLTRALALEWARTGVTVNGIGVGFLEDVPGIGRDESAKKALEHYLPLRRLARSEEMAGLAVYLASDASEFVTGQTIFVEGGALAHV